MGFKTIVAGAALAIAALAVTGPASAQEHEEIELIEQEWEHEGIFGTYNRAAAQRGLQVYRQVCAGCHGLDYVAFRNLQDIGFSEEQIEALAAEYTITDGPNDEGEMFEREGRPSDLFPAPFANEGQARAANAGAYPPDLSLLTKARASGTDYIYSLLRGYTEPPADAEEARPGMYYNAYFPGHWIAMPPPLNEGVVEYSGEAEATVAQMAHDVAVFLTWTAEPKLEERKQMGLKVMLFLIVITALFFAAKRKIWAELH